MISRGRVLMCNIDFCSAETFIIYSVRPGRELQRLQNYFLLFLLPCFLSLQLTVDGFAIDKMAAEVKVRELTR